MLGCQHAGEHGVVAALDARHVDEAGRAADQRAARESQLRHRLVAALGDGACAIGDALAALEGLRDQRMVLEALEFVEGREVRIGVVEVDDEADHYLVVLQMVKEGAAAGLALSSGQPKECWTRPGTCFLRVDLPQFLDADAVFLWLATFIQSEAGDQRLGQAARARLRRTGCTCPAVPCRA